MKKPTVIILIIAVLAGGAFVISNMSSGNKTQPVGDTSSRSEMQNDMQMSGADKSEPSEPVNPNEVQIKDFAFGPETITVKKGTKVKWTNQDSARHDVSPTSGGEDFKASELLAKGESYEFTFNTVGTYTYKCSPHPYMKGTVVVTE